MIRFDEEIIAAILEHIKTHGMIRGCTANIPCNISEKTIRRYLDKHNRYYKPEFFAQVQDALEFYGRTNRHPSEDPEIKQDAIAQFRAAIKAGQSNEQTIVYDESGKPIKKFYRKPGVEKWVWETIFPPRSITEQAILTVTSNQLNDLARFPFRTEEQRKEAMAWLSDWMRRATEELYKQGLSVRYLDVDDSS